MERRIRNTLKKKGYDKKKSYFLASSWFVTVATGLACLQNVTGSSPGLSETFYHYQLPCTKEYKSK